MGKLDIEQNARAFLLTLENWHFLVLTKMPGHFVQCPISLFDTEFPPLTRFKLDMSPNTQINLGVFVF